LSLEYFEGPAGCGKTYQLVEALKTFLASRPLGHDQAILGLTYMHGSRRRMHSRLTKISALHGRFLASTVDSVARSIVWRWRTMAKEIEPLLDFGGVADFETVCRVAALLLRKKVVSDWLCIRYPVAVVDEFQDCKGDRLCIIQAVETCCHVIAAADEYQDLQPTGSNAAVAWLHGGGGKKTVLTGNWRTKQTVLLQAAHRLRSSQDCGDALQGALMSGLNANAAAGGIARTLCWKQCKNAVILTPTGPEKSGFVRDVVARLVSKPITPSGINKPVGPFRVIWESNVVEEKALLISQLGSAAKAATLQQIRVLSSGDTGTLSELYHWAERRFRIKGQDHFSGLELSTTIDRILQSRRAFLPTEHPGVIRAMTISQAKNREFEGVIVLWPFAVGGDLESQRRRLYNALTRAQKWAIVIVQDDAKKASRLLASPFSKPPKAASA
jgi:UvrD-like helicase C-terminal domain/AAA domain